MKHIISLIQRYFLFGLSFVFTKGAVYFVPLLLADVLSTNDYGVLEYALAGLGFVLNALINIGVPSGYPYFVLKLNNNSILNGFKLHPLWLLLLFVINQLAYLVFNFSIELYLAFNVAYIIASQELYSIRLKSHEKPTMAIFLDSGVYIVLLLLIVLRQLTLLPINLAAINTIILIYACLYAVKGIYDYITCSKAHIVKNYKTILNYSFNIMIATFLIFLITSSGRILAEYFFGYDEVAVYGFYFRLAAIVVMVYQMVNIIFFKKIYTVNPEILDKYYSLFFVFIITAALIIFSVSPHVMTGLSGFFKTTYEAYKPVYFLLSAQMVMWIATALNSNIIDRENLAKTNNVRFFALILLGTGLMFLFKNKLTLQLMVFIHYSIIFIACLIQYYSLNKKNIQFKKAVFVLSTSYALTTCYYFIFL